MWLQEASLMLTVLYACAGTGVFLTAAHAVFTKEDEHADGVFTRLFG